MSLSRTQQLLYLHVSHFMFFFFIFKFLLKVCPVWLALFGHAAPTPDVISLVFWGSGVTLEIVFQPEGQVKMIPNKAVERGTERGQRYQRLIKTQQRSLFLSGQDKPDITAVPRGWICGVICHVWLWPNWRFVTFEPTLESMLPEGRCKSPSQHQHDAWHLLITMNSLNIS